ncbi:hypothetical protein [Kribbella deserti]|uniref:FlgD Ig-like domain-containing protein n=1 Tax=Kribbella deserti TaxID=1926257 RepID=A0ABV6QNR0_9ACTN
MTWRTGTAAIAALALIPAGTTAAQALHLHRAAASVTTEAVLTGTHAVAVQPGRISYSKGGPNSEGWTRFEVFTRTTSITAGKLVLGPEQKLLSDTQYAALSGSAGWLQYGGNQLRDSAGVITELPGLGSAPPQASGNRIMLRGRQFVGSPPTNWSWPTRIDLQTMTYTGRPEVAALFGNHMIHAAGNNNEAIVVADVVRNVRAVHYSGTTRIVAVAISGKWLAWVTGCPSTEPCAQTLTIRDTAAKTQRTIATKGTTSLKLSGGYLAFDAKPGTQRELRTIKHGTSTQLAAGTLPASPNVGRPVDARDVTPDQFDLDDETLVWTDKDLAFKAVQLAPFINAPVYLGAAFAPSSMTTSWTLKLPVSKALPTCQVTIYRGTAKVRVFNCANTDGMVIETWNGKTSTGATLPKGTYTYRVTGQDADKYNLRNYDGTLTAVGGSITKTA